MVRTADIIAFSKVTPAFSPKELAEHLCTGTRKPSTQSICNILSKMVADGLLEKTGKGQYAITYAGRRVFTPYHDDTITQIETTLRQQFPLANFCVWNSADLKNLSHYIVNMDVIWVDIERDAMELAFVNIKKSGLERQTFLAPTAKDYELYIYGKPSIVIRPLVTEAPLLPMGENFTRVSMEKILVDAAIDHDFLPFQEFEILNVYNTAFERYEINQSKMLRYARRRGHEEEIKENIIEKDKILDYDTYR
ncbi:MAG: hypothetical protein KHX42_04490 [Prevotella sp.]|nr:hypothetical protein [Prevotella sp.]